MQALRTFIALALPGQLQNMLADVKESFGDSRTGIRWVKPENIHLTLKFLGATPEHKLKSVCSALDRSTAACSPVACEVSGIGAFPNERNPKVLWAGITSTPELSLLQQRLEDLLEGAGFAPEKRPFSPHVTLGRVKDSRVRPALRTVMERLSKKHFGTHEASRIVFFSSELKPGGPVYSCIKSVAL